MSNGDPWPVMIFFFTWGSVTWKCWSCTYLWWPKSSVSQRGIYVHVTLSKCSYDSAPIMNPDEMTPENILHLHSRWHDLLLWSRVPPLMSPPVRFFFLFFMISIHSLHPKVNPIGWMLCRGSLWTFSPRCCYLLPADRAMNSGPKWNSYCYQKHKIPITLGVRAETRKWNRYS